MKRSSRTAGAVILALVVGMFAGMVPAFGAHATNDTANLGSTGLEAVTGQLNKTFPITISHASGTNDDPILPGNQGTAPVNYIIITTPGGFRALGASVPAGGGWVATPMPSADGFANRIELKGGTLAHSGNLVVNVFADVPTVGKDRNSIWRVQTSSDGTTANGTADEATGSLTTRVRVLLGDSLRLTAPAGVTDNIVTQDQTATAICAVRNAGNATRNVTAELAGSGFAVESAPAARAIAPGAVESFTFGIKFGNPGSINMSCGGSDAAAQTSTGPNVSTLPVTVQAKRVPTYAAGSLTPRAVNPNVAGPLVFTLRVNFAGQPAATLNPALTNFQFCGVTANLTSTNQLPAGAQNSWEMKFTVPAGVPNLPNGTCPTTLNIAGEDENNALIDFRPVSGTESIKIDSLLPTVDPTLRAPTTQVPGTNDAAKNNDTVNFGGSVTDTDPASGESVPCGAPSCSIVTDPYEAGKLHSRPVMFQYGELNCSGPEIAAPIPVNVTLGATGTLSGSYANVYDPKTQCVILRVSVQDEAGNRHTDISSGIEIDNIVPKILSATAVRTSETEGGTTVQRTIRLTFSECILGAMAAADFSYEPSGTNPPNVVTAAGAAQCTNGQPSQVDLTMARDFLDEEVQGATLTYAPQALVGGTRPKDRVGLTLPNTDLNVVDGIEPLAPVITKVNGQDPSGGIYYVGNAAATVTVENKAGHYERQPNGDELGRAVRDGYEVKISKADGTVIGAGEAQGNTITVNVNLGSLTNGTFDLDIRATSFDAVKNDRAGDLVRVVLDLVRPTITNVVALASSMEVTFSETLVAGANHFRDWQVRMKPDSEGISEQAAINAVTGTGNVRILSMGSGYDPTNVQFLAYLYFGNGGACGTGSTAADDGDCRYQDASANQVLDQTVNTINQPPTP